MRAVVLLVVVCVTRVAESVGHRCYVCVPRLPGSAVEVHRMFPDVLQHCEDWRPDDPRFMRDCPANHSGCQTQTNGSHVTRTCGDADLDACNTANNIKYCYCRGALCNRPAAAELTDDEDLVEGSGTEPPRPGKTHTTVAIGVMTTATPAASDAARQGVATTALVFVTWCAIRV